VTQQIVAIGRANASKHELCQLTKSGCEKAGRFENREDSLPPPDASFTDKNAR